MTYTDLPLINACLNTSSAVLLVLGWRHIRAGRKEAHRNCMIAALCTSAAFLACYLYYHWKMQQVHGAAHTKFVDPAWFRPIYLTILFTHLVGAFAIIPLVLMTVSRAVKRFALQMPARLKHGEWRAFGLDTPRDEATRPEPAAS